MATNRSLRHALLRKLDITPQALSQRVQKKKSALPMSTEDATYLIAHEAGIKIDQFVDQAALQRVRQLAVAAPVSSQGRVAPMRVRTDKAAPRAIHFPSEFRMKDPILSTRTLNEAKEMAGVYPLLYVLENSIREVIARVLEAKYGPDWWNTRLNSGKTKTVKQNAEARMTDERRHEWHQRRGGRPIDYVDLKDLDLIVRAHEGDFFPTILSGREWFGQFMRELYPSRCVLCHMNPLDNTNVKDVKLKLERWNKQISAVRSKIP